jgi:hypothetical protein
VVDDAIFICVGSAPHPGVGGMFSAAGVRKCRADMQQDCKEEMPRRYYNNVQISTKKDL